MRKGIGLKISLILGILLVLGHLIIDLLPAYRMNLARIDTYLPENVFSMWMPLSGELYSYIMIVTVYALGLPLLSAIPYADSLYMDRKTGYLKNLLIRADKRKVCGCRYLVIFLSGGIAAVFPLILDFYICLLLFPFHSMMPGRIYGRSAGCLMGKLLYLHPFVYLVGFLFLVFVFGGLWACMVPVFRGIVDNRFLLMLIPFVVGYFAQAILEMAGPDFWSFEPRVVVLAYGGVTWVHVIVNLGLLLALVLIFGYRREVRDDVY